MTRTRSSRAATDTDRQSVQRELVERGRKIPGVAEAVEVYGRVQRHVGVAIGQASPKIRHATGGNV